MKNSLLTVPKTWYRLYWAFILLFGVAVIGVGIAARQMPNLANLGSTFGLNAMTISLGVVVVLYCLIPYWLMYKSNPQLAILGAFMLFSLVLFSGLTLSNESPSSWVYAAGWFVSMLFSGIFGVQTILGSLFLVSLYVLMSTGFNLNALQLQHGVLISGSGILSLASYLIWRNRITNPHTDDQLTQMAGMLRSKEEQAVILIQSIADGVIVTNTDGKISIMNRAAANLTGWTVEEATGIDVQLVFKVAKENGTEIAADDYPFKAVLSHKAFINQVLQLSARNGKKRIVSIVISPFVTSTGEVFGAVGVMRDVSEERAAEAQRAEFISTASHEMRTPVAAIEGYLSLALNDKVSTIDSRAREYIDKAHLSTKHLGKLFQDLLTSAKAEDGRLTSHPAVVEMGSFLEQLVEALRFSAQKKGLDCEFNVGSTESIDATKDTGGGHVVKPLYYTFVDPDRIREVISNIFDNAVKYTEQGKVSVGLTGNNEVVQVYIRDTGAGIPAEDAPHLFQKFYRVDNSATRTIGGTGLGLFIARKIIELYHGRIWVTSEVGKGSTFFINLPRLSNDKAQQLIQAAASQATSAPASTTKP